MRKTILYTLETNSIDVGYELIYSRGRRLCVWAYISVLHLLALLALSQRRGSSIRTEQFVFCTGDQCSVSRAFLFFVFSPRFELSLE